jgi:hypothetical protein
MGTDDLHGLAGFAAWWETEQVEARWLACTDAVTELTRGAESLCLAPVELPALKPPRIP